MLYQSEAFLVLLLVVAITRGNGRDCLQSASRDTIQFNDLGNSSSDGVAVLSLPAGTQAIVTTYQFHCCGNITGWRAYKLSGDAPIFFQVWRPTSEGCYTRVGENNCLPETLTKSQNCRYSENQVEFLSPADNMISFQSGDVVGYFTGSSATGGGGIQLDDDNYDEDMIWYNGRNDATTSVLDDSSQCVRREKGLNLVARAGPVISVEIVPSQCPSPSTSAPLTMPITESNERDRLPPPTVQSNVTEGKFADHDQIVTTMDGSIAMEEQMTDRQVTVKEQTTTLLTAATVLNGSNTIALIVGVVMGVATFVSLLVVIIMAIFLLRRKASMKNPVITSHENSYPKIRPTGENGALYMDPQSAINDSDYTNSQDSGYCMIGPGSRRNQQMDNDNYAVPNIEETIQSEFEGEFDCTDSYVPTEEQRQIKQLDTKANMKNGGTSYNRLQFFVQDQVYWAPATTASGLYTQLATKKYREINRKQIRILNKLGSNQFGEVYKVSWRNGNNSIHLAVKTLKSNVSQDEKIKFLQEAAIMGQFSHSNVIKLYGVVTVGEPLMICSELLMRGSLRSHLQNIGLSNGLLKKSFTKTQILFLRFAREIACGMNYLSHKNFVHRDLATRSVYMDQSLTCKIGDFGMARDLMDDTYYKSSGGKIPVKWTAPEALLYHKYSMASDVWSYGMVLFEIWSVAKKPFSTSTNEQVLRLIQAGHCQPPPPGCPRNIYQLMVDCWNPDHQKRPSFDDIYNQSLQQSSAKILHWSTEDETLSPSVWVLGAPLKEGSKLHLQLQHKYVNVISEWK